MKSSNSFAVELDRRRRDRGMSLGEVAARTSYSASYISKLLHGHRPLLPAVVRELDDAVDADGALERIAAEQRRPSSDVARPMQLPLAVANFVGREPYLRQLDGALAEQSKPGIATTILIDGGFWCGKTALAVHWVAGILDRFPGGCLFAELRGAAPGAPADPAAVLDGFLRTLGADPSEHAETVDDRARRFRSLLAARPAVVVLDNAAGYDQIRPLLPGAGSLVVITSREHQAGVLFATGGLHLELPALTADEALVLLRKRIGDARAGAEARAAEVIVRRCGRLPMAVLIAGEHLLTHPHQTLRDMAEWLGHDRRRLDLLSSADPAVNLRGVIDLSYLALDPKVARLFRLLGFCLAHTVTPESAAALAGIDVDDARYALDVLLRAHLLETTDGGRLRMNHLLRSYASERAVVEDYLSELEYDCARLLRWYIATAWSANNALSPNWAGMGLTPENTTGFTPMTFDDPDYSDAVAWCDAEVDTAIFLARHWRTRLEGDAVWLLPTMFLPYFYLTKNWSAWLTAATDGLAAARDIGSEPGIARCLQSMGWVMHELSRTSEAVEYLSEAMEIHTRLGDDRMRAWTAFGLAATYTTLDRHDDARDSYLLADTLFTSTDLPLGNAVARAMLATTYGDLGQPAEALACAQDALARAQGLSLKQVTSMAHHRLGLVLLQHGEERPALTQLDAALALRRTSHERWGEAETLIARAETLSALNEPELARQSFVDAADILDALHDPRAMDIQAQIATLNACLQSRNKDSRTTY